MTTLEVDLFRDMVLLSSQTFRLAHGVGNYCNPSNSPREITFMAHVG
jgi:hypothetical protein